MRYRLTCLTPLLGGDGRKLAPIDYMVWKDHVNVLDQRRIFRLLAKGVVEALEQRSPTTLSSHTRPSRV